MTKHYGRMVCKLDTELQCSKCTQYKQQGEKITAVCSVGGQNFTCIFFFKRKTNTHTHTHIHKQIFNPKSFEKLSLVYNRPKKSPKQIHIQYNIADNRTI
jgi:hypothetical protein